jgi:hypothetical protein
MATRSSCAPVAPLTRSSGFHLFLARFLEAMDTLLDELLVFPATPEDVPHHRGGADGED